MAETRIETRIEPRRVFYRWTCPCGESGPWYDEPDHSAIRGGRAVHEGTLCYPFPRGDERMSTCVFCEKIAAGTVELIPGSDVVTFEPLNPVTEGHRLFVPLIHVEDAADAPHITGVTFRAAAAYAKPMADAFNLITSVGADATQTVRHLHVHLVPRREGDGLALPWTGQDR